jgi:hypothetical protein
VRFLLRFANHAKFLPSDRKPLTMLTYQAVQSLGADVGNLRISSSAIELDLLLESDDRLQEVTKLLERKLGPLLTSRKLDVETSPIEKTESSKGLRSSMTSGTGRVMKLWSWRGEFHQSQKRRSCRA